MNLRAAGWLVCLAVLAGCSPSPPAASTAPARASAVSAAASTPGEVDYRCRVDADCAVKDVGNCCGRYPACVNRDSPTFPDQVAAECARTGMSGICGYPEISGCRCVEQRCAAVTDSAETH
ncbi:MAG TPA: hypothetical protein VMR06_17850 [Dokdonella sp.]|uniref:hypothetical protein n=1 Tax=Dokdonella sp. TaxID=2291710 RepID=UPI002BB9D877|nr:hypothetical protein [Dokdonella sp.]HUD43853.1 hypothetical protein [Dokdonella sp.]